MKLQLTESEVNILIAALSESERLIKIERENLVHLGISNEQRAILSKAYTVQLAEIEERSIYINSALN